VTVINGAGSTIQTYGSGAHGVLAQSIGGGGGNAGGGAASGSGDTITVNVAVGGSGGVAGGGGAVTVTNSGTIRTGANFTSGGSASTLVSSGSTATGAYNYTTGGDAAGIIAQSIGGGGGTAGTSDPQANISNLDQLLDARTRPSTSFVGNVSVGGAGGAGGDGNTVQVNSNGGTIVTLGERAYGVLAQSIGGGGGSGGAASSSAQSVYLQGIEGQWLKGLKPGQLSEEEIQEIDQGSESSGTGRTYSASVAVGGSGGASGYGGAVGVALTGASVIDTAGYGATAILAQSIGGGGGVGADGSPSDSTTIGIGYGQNGSSGAGSTGGTVTVNVAAGGSLLTLGDDAQTILAQSIGGGGGVANAGCTTSGSASAQGLFGTTCFGGGGSASGEVSPWNGGFSANVVIGGGSGASGNGGAVNIDAEGAIVTTGARSIAIVAQSIGGGGGFTSAANQNLATQLAPSPGQNVAKGGAVSVSLGATAPTASITTSGAGAWGILAQSVGGGGGFDGDPSLPMGQLPLSNTLSDTSASQASTNSAPDGGSVTVTVGGSIVTSGANAHGVVAQSVGGSGGLVGGCAGCTPNAWLLAGNSAQIYSLSQGSYAGMGGAVTVTQSAGSLIKTEGAGSIGIFAQSTGKNDHTSPINITIGGTVVGGTTTGQTSGGVGAAGIVVTGGILPGSSTPGNVTNNLITVNAGGSVKTMDGVTGNAIITGYGMTNVVNGGAITGSINLGAAPGTIENNSGGLVNSGPTIVTSQLSNSGTINVYGPGVIGVTDLTGAFSQTSGGALQVDINANANQKADLLNVSGAASVAGTVAPLATALEPGTYTVINAASVSGSPTVAPSYLFNWSVEETATSLALSPSANFTPAGLSLTATQTSLAGYLDRAWANTDPHFATVFGSLSQIQNGAAYLGVLNGAVAGAVSAQGTNLARAGVDLLGRALSCPHFVGDGVVLGEDSCEWVRGIGGQASQYAGAGTIGYTVGSDALRMGLQKQVAPGWYVGGAFGAGSDWVSATNFSSSGQIYDGSIAVKYLTGNWMFAGSAAFADGSFSNSRYFNGSVLPNAPLASGTLSSDSSVFQGGGRLRAAYEFAFANTYIRPYADLDLIYTTSPSFDETGMSGDALAYASSHQTDFVVSPMVELGGRYDFGDGLTLRGFADVGASFKSNDRWVTSASFIGASAADGQFQIASTAAPVVGRVNLGAQLYARNGWDLQALYGLEAGKQYLGQVGSVRLALHF